MIPEKEVKAKVTPEIIKKMCELADGFKHEEHWSIPSRLQYKVSYGCNMYEQFKPISSDLLIWSLFPLLIHRAVGGWNSNQKPFLEIVIYKDKVCLEDYKIETYKDIEYYNKYTYQDKRFEKYQPDSLTSLECACLDCLVEVLG